MARKPRLTRERVLDAAIELVDRDGLSKLSMRRLGDQLGVEAMALYRHVGSKSELLDRLQEAILNLIELPAPTGDWAADMRAAAYAFRRVLAEHPNALPLFATRPAATLGAMAYVEFTLTLLDDAGFSTETALTAFQTLLAFVIGHCLLHFVPGENAPDIDYDALAPDRFPHLLRAVRSLDTHDADREFDLGLTALLRGLASIAR